MREHPNALLVRKGYDAFHTGDLDTVRQLMAPDVVWHQPGRSALAGDYKGPDEVIRFLTELWTLSGGTFNADIVELLADAERVVVFQHETASRDGDIFDELAVVDFEVHGGRMTEANVYHADMYRFDEFFS